jgi:hypothetical protein
MAAEERMMAREVMVLSGCSMREAVMSSGSSVPWDGADSADAGRERDSSRAGRLSRFIYQGFQQLGGGGRHDGPQGANMMTVTRA